MYEQSHRDYLALIYPSSSACHGLLIITVITPLPTKPKHHLKLKLADAAITDMQMRQCCCARCKIHEKVILFSQEAENDALRDDVAAGRVGCTSKQSVNQCVKPPPRRG